MESVPPWQFVAMLRRSIDEVLVQKKKDQPSMVTEGVPGGFGWALFQVH
jgi:hypothetical protein